MKAYFRDVDTRIVGQSGLDFPREKVGRMRRVNVQVRRGECGWMRRKREVEVWD